MAEPSTGDVVSERASRDRAHYDAVAASLFQKDLYGPSASARRHRHVQSIRLAGSDRLGRVLELGCGCGFGARYLDGRYDAYVGIDHSTEVIAAATTLDLGASVKFEQADATVWQSSERFDTVFMIGVLHHMPDPLAALRNILRSVRKGGTVVANEPQSGNPVISLARKVRARADGDYSEEQDEYSAAHLRAIFTEADLKDVRLHPQGLFSTPFAEVAIKPRFLAGPAARLSCAIDRAIERTAPGAIRRLSWNLVAVGRT